MKAMIIVFAAALAVSGCARDLSPGVYSRDEVGSKVDIQDVREDAPEPSKSWSRKEAEA
jgi:hypothetical protein